VYSNNLWCHARDPKHRGDLTDANATASASFPKCGDHFCLQLKLDDGKISDAKFSAKACFPVIAMGSVGCELIIGRTVEQALRLYPTQLDQALGGLPISKRHAVMLFLECLHQALLPHLPDEQGESS